MFTGGSPETAVKLVETDSVLTAGRKGTLPVPGVLPFLTSFYGNAPTKFPKN
jgi:hypothetical protein